MIGRLLATYRSNTALKKEITKLKKKLILSQKRLSMALDLLQKNGIEYQMRLLPNESTDDDEEENPQNINITEEEKTKIILIDNLISNLSKNKYRYTYT